MRCKFTDQDVLVMENFYKNEPYPTTDQRFELAELLGKPVKSVSGWFAGRRRKQVQNGEDRSALSKPINQQDTDGLLARLHGTRSIRNISSQQHPVSSELAKPVKSAETDEMIKGARLDIIKPGDPDSPDLKTIRKILDMDAGKMRQSPTTRPERILDSVYIPNNPKPLPSISSLENFNRSSLKPQVDSPRNQDVKAQSEVLLLTTPKSFTNTASAKSNDDTDEEIDVLSLSEDTEKKMEQFDRAWAKKEYKKPSFEILNEEPIDLTSPIRSIPRPVHQTTVRQNASAHPTSTIQSNTGTARPYQSIGQNLIRQNQTILPKPSLPAFTAQRQIPVASNAATHLALRVQATSKPNYGFQAAGMSRDQMVQQLHYLNRQIEWKRRLLNRYISIQQVTAQATVNRAAVHQPFSACFNPLAQSKPNNF